MAENPKFSMNVMENGDDGPRLPLVVALNCLDDCVLEQRALRDVAIIQHVGLSRLAEGRIEKAMAVLLHSFSYLPRAAQKRMKAWQIILCLGSTDKAEDSSQAATMGLNLLHVDIVRGEEVSETVMALILGLVRHTHLLSRQGLSSSGWLGSLQPLCRGMRRCHGLVLGIIGRSASACALAVRSLSFKMNVIYYDFDKGKGKSLRGRRSFPAAAKQMDTLNDLLSLSDVVSLHCAVTNETLQILNADTLQHVKPGAFIVNTSSSHLVDDCALKQMLINGTIAGCALDGAEGPQWMEAWVREMPNVLILPKSADYSEEAWYEIRAKAVSILHTFFTEGVLPINAVSDDEEIEVFNDTPTLEESTYNEKTTLCIRESELLINEENNVSPEYRQKQANCLSQEYVLQSQESGVSQNSGGNQDVRHSRSGKKGKKRPGRRKSQQKAESSILLERENNCVALPRDDHGASVSGREQVSSSSRFASPEDSRHKRSLDSSSAVDTASENQAATTKGPFGLNGELLKDGLVISLLAKGGYHVSKQKGPGGGWILDTLSNVTKRDPAAQFQVVYPSKGRIGLRSLAAGGKLLQVNNRGELVFSSHQFDAWDTWILEGSTLEECRLVNSRNNKVSLHVFIEVLAAVSEEDGIARWLS